MGRVDGLGRNGEIGEVARSESGPVGGELGVGIVGWARSGVDGGGREAVRVAVVPGVHGLGGRLEGDGAENQRGGRTRGGW